MSMASLTRNTQRDWKVRFRIYYPDGSERVALAFRAAKRAAEILLGQASQLESITRKNALTPDTAVPFLPWKLLKPEDLAPWLPGNGAAFGLIATCYWRNTAKIADAR
jgi:hypothetical protein